jgi:hypothetical protein
MKLYLSGKYSGDIDANIEEARKIAIELWERGYTCLTPHLNTYHFEVDCKCVYEDYIRGDLELIVGCDAMVMLPVWEQSSGAKIEKEFAKSIGVPVYYYPQLPQLPKRMSDKQERHLAGVISKITRAIDKKYRIGQAEHGGNLFDKPNMPMLLEEVQDMVVYAYTLQEQLIQAQLEDDCGERTYNILNYGNRDGKELKDERNVETSST